MIIDLEEKIKQQQEESEIPEEIATKIEQANRELEESGAVDGLKVGTAAPNFTLSNASSIYN
jgi:hypothetical protein